MSSQKEKTMSIPIPQNLDAYLHPVTSFETAEIQRFEKGLVEVTFPIVPTMCNLYGIVHGGATFALCDTIAGLVTLSLNRTCVTLSSSINYIKAAKGGALHIKGSAVHAGKTSIVVQVNVTDDIGSPIATASFTMFALDPPDAEK